MENSLKVFPIPAPAVILCHCARRAQLLGQCARTHAKIYSTRIISRLPANSTVVGRNTPTRELQSGLAPVIYSLTIAEREEHDTTRTLSGPIQRALYFSSSRAQPSRDASEVELYRQPESREYATRFECAVSPRERPPLVRLLSIVLRAPGLRF